VTFASPIVMSASGLGWIHHRPSSLEIEAALSTSMGAALFGW
jgi:hypothetical protein